MTTNDRIAQCMAVFPPLGVCVVPSASTIEDRRWLYTNVSALGEVRMAYTLVAIWFHIYLCMGSCTWAMCVLPYLPCPGAAYSCPWTWMTMLGCIQVYPGTCLYNIQVYCFSTGYMQLLPTFVLSGPNICIKSLPVIDFYRQTDDECTLHLTC